MFYSVSTENEVGGTGNISTSLVTVSESLIPVVDAAKDLLCDSILFQLFENGKPVSWCRMDPNEEITYETVVASLMQNHKG